MLTISLEKMKFRAFYGIYPEEKILGNELLAEIKVSIEETGPITWISQTVDYEKVYHIIAEEIKRPHYMLEELVQICIDRIKKDFPQILMIEMQLSKLHPPLSGEVGCSKVTLKREFKNHIP